MKIKKTSFCWVALLAGLLTVNLQANPLTDPRRLVDGQTVNLLPLFKWWTNHSGPRPLAAWVHVTGVVSGTNAAGWILEGQVEHSAYSTKKERTTGGERKIILRNPPLQDQAEFLRLSAQLKTLNEERASIAAQETAAHNRAQAISREQNAYGRRLRSGALAQENRQVRSVEGEAKAELKLLDQQIQSLKKQLAAYPNPEHYVVDCFALDTMRDYQGMPVYDHGTGFGSR